MKVAVTFLIVLGLLAAASAAVLVSVLTRRAPTAQGPHASEEVEILVAARTLPAMSMVDGGAVKTQKVPRSQLPEHALTNPVQVVGRVLTTNLVEGEIFSAASFARKSDGLYLAAALPRGKRAISVSLSDWSCMAGLLYPGGVVDVLVSFKPPGAQERDSEMVSTTLLQGLQVLAIGSQSVAAEEYSDKEPGALATKGQTNFRMVTLLVDPKQAEILQLAIQSGNISLAMRNPLDAGRDGRRLTRTAEMGQPGGASPDGQMLALLAAIPKKNPIATPEAAPVPAKAVLPVPELWETLIVRGAAIEKRLFPMAEARKQAGSPVKTAG